MPKNKERLDTRIEVRVYSRVVCLACEAEITEGFPVIGGVICEPCAQDGTKFSMEFPDGSTGHFTATSWVNSMHYEVQPC